jgi:hypothetical protein
LGAKEFAQSNGPALTDAAESRLIAALEAGSGADARLVLLTLHSHVIHPSVVERFNLESV